MKLTILILALVASLPATATEYRETGNAISVCTPARPVYDNGVRRRPLAIVNESAAAGTFINCGFRTQPSSYGSDSFGVVLANYTNQAHTVTCTGVIGTEGDAVFQVKSTVVPAHGKALASWGRDAQGRNRWPNAGIQCLLKIGVGMTELPQAFRGEG